jgi:hypothetical protein
MHSSLQARTDRANSQKIFAEAVHEFKENRSAVDRVTLDCALLELAANDDDASKLALDCDALLDRLANADGASKLWHLVARYSLERRQRQGLLHLILHQYILAVEACRAPAARRRVVDNISKMVNLTRRLQSLIRRTPEISSILAIQLDGFMEDLTKTQIDLDRRYFSAVLFSRKPSLRLIFSILLLNLLRSIGKSIGAKVTYGDVARLTNIALGCKELTGEDIRVCCGRMRRSKAPVLFRVINSSV